MHTLLLMQLRQEVLFQQRVELALRHILHAEHALPRSILHAEEALHLHLVAVLLVGVLEPDQGGAGRSGWPSRG